MVSLTTLILLAHNFFEPQPVHANPVAVYVLRHITHNWSTPHCQTILRHLTKDATPTTRVLVLDFIVPYVCKTPASTASSAALGQYKPTPSPVPLLPSAGSENIFDLDMNVCIFLNSLWVSFLDDLHYPR
jgi:hypothetical protein